MMFNHKITERVKGKTYFDWALLAFSAGSVNSGGFIACHRFVSHVTGFATLAGVGAASGNWTQALQMMTVPIYFLFGVMVSAYLVDRRIHDNQKPLYSVAMGLACLALLIAGLGGTLDWFGRFGIEMDARQDYLFLALLCGASGLQNAALTSSSGATIRTTHLTGITTDLGIGLVRMAGLKRTDEKFASEAQANVLRFMTIFAFMLGSGIGAVLFLRYQYVAFLLPGAITFYAMSVAFIDEKF